MSNQKKESPQIGFVNYVSGKRGSGKRKVVLDLVQEWKDRCGGLDENIRFMSYNEKHIDHFRQHFSEVSTTQCAKDYTNEVLQQWIDETTASSAQTEKCFVFDDVFYPSSSSLSACTVLKNLIETARENNIRVILMMQYPIDFRLLLSSIDVFDRLICWFGNNSIFDRFLYENFLQYHGCFKHLCKEEIYALFISGERVLPTVVFLEKGNRQISTLCQFST